MADIRPILLSTLAALDKIHSQSRLLNTKELDTYENIRFNSKCQVCFINSFFKQNRPSVISPLESPEVLLNSEYVTKKSDVWSFGCLLLYLLRGKHIFYGSTTTQILASICQANLNKDGIRSMVSAKCGENVIDIISKCLQRVPSERPTIREIFKHKFWAKEGLGETMEQDIAKYFTNKINNILLDKKVVEEEEDSIGNKNNRKSHHQTDAAIANNNKITSDIERTTNVKIDKTIPIVRDNILHLTVDKIRLASTTVTWAAAFSQSPVKMVHIMLSINVWKNVNDMNTFGKKFYANKWCDGSPISGTLADGSFISKIGQNFRYNISSKQLFRGLNRHHFNNNKSPNETAQKSRELMAIILIRLESIIIGSAIVPLSNIGSMGVINGYYHITHQGKIMGQIKVSACPTAPNIIDESSYIPVLSMSSPTTTPSSSSSPPPLSKEKEQNDHQQQLLPTVPKLSMENLYGSDSNSTNNTIDTNNSINHSSRSSGREDHFLTLLKVTGGEDSEAARFKAQDNEISINIKTRLKNIRSAVENLKVFQKNNGKAPSLERFAASGGTNNNEECDPNNEFIYPPVTVHRGHVGDNRHYSNNKIKNKNNNSNRRDDHFSPSSSNQQSLSMASSSLSSSRKNKNKNRTRSKFNNNNNNNNSKSINRKGRSTSRNQQQRKGQSPKYINNVDIDSINILNRSDSSSSSSNGNSSDNIVAANENFPPADEYSLTPSKNFQRMQSRLEKWSTWWESQNGSGDMSFIDDDENEFANETTFTSSNSRRSNKSRDSKVMGKKIELNNNTSGDGTWWQVK